MSDTAEIIQADRDAGQALLEQLHAIMRAQGAEVADTTVKDDGCIVQALARHRAAYAIPPGWKAVPIEATPEMLKAPDIDDLRDGWTVPIWRAFLASSPNPPEVVQDAG